MLPPPPAAPVLLGIAGGTASGKTSLTRNLAAHLGPRCAVLTHDDYYRPLPPDYLHRPEAWNFDHPDALENELLAEHLTRLAAGEAVDAPTYDLARMIRLPAVRRVEPRPVILVEGILVLAVDVVRQALHTCIYVETPDPVRLTRRRERDQQERGRTLAEIDERWATSVHPMHLSLVAPSRRHADLIVDGTADPRESLMRVLGLEILRGRV